MKDNFVAMKASLLVVASFGLVAYGAVQWKHNKRLPKTNGNTVSRGDQSEQQDVSQDGQLDGVSVSAPKSLPEIDREVRLKKVIQANLSHVNLNRSIVVFENGTSVIVKEPSLDPVGRAKEILTRCHSRQIKFKTHTVEEGRTIVSFEKGAIYQWLFPDDASVVGTWPIDEIRDLLAPAEQTKINGDWNPPLHVRMGLTARKWLSTDIVDLQVVKVLRGAIDTGVGQIEPVDVESN